MLKEQDIVQCSPYLENKVGARQLIWASVSQTPLTGVPLVSPQ